MIVKENMGGRGGGQGLREALLLYKLSDVSKVLAWHIVCKRTEGGRGGRKGGGGYPRSLMMKDPAPQQYISKLGCKVGTALSKRLFDALSLVLNACHWGVRADSTCMSLL